MKRIYLAALALLTLTASALAQSNPGLVQGFVPTAGQWNSYFSAKQDYLGYTPVNKAGDTMLGELVTTATTVSSAGFNLPPGTAPSTPVNGDLWTTSSGLFARINGVTVGPMGSISNANFAATAPIAVTFPSNVVTYALNIDSNFAVVSSNLALASIASGNLIANSTAGSAEPTTTTLTALIDRALGSGSANVLVRGASSWAAVAMSGDVAIATGGATTIQANVVTYAKFQQVAAVSLVGNPTGSTANAQGVTVGATLTFVSTALQTVAISGDVTSSANSFSTTVAKINGATLGTTTATSGNLLIGSGSQWVTQPITGAISLTSGGVTALTSSAFANPAATIGLSTVNGSATTAMRSDAAPALSQAIAPTWTAQHIYNVASTVVSSAGAALDDWKMQAATTTITGTTTITALEKVGIYQPTLTDGSAVTVTDAATLYVDNSPAQAGSVTITNAWAIRVGAGNVKFPGSGNVLGTITSGTWNGSVVDMAHGGSNANLTASNGGIVWTNGTQMQVLGGTATASQCLLSGSNAAPSWGSCSGGAAVSSVSNSDGTLTISPTTGAVVASINLAHANTWTGKQIISGASFQLSGNITASTWTTSGIRYTDVAGTLTDNTAATGTTATQYTSVHGGDTIAATNTGVIYTNYYGEYFKAPTAGTNVTLTNAWALGADSVRIGTSNQFLVGTGGNVTLASGATMTIAGTINVTGTFQSAGNAMTFPSSTATLAALNISSQTITGGATVTTLADTTGNLTVNCGLRPIQSITNGGAWTLTAPSSDSSCILIVTNNASAGAITFSGFTVGSATGATPDTTNGHIFSIFIWRANGTSGYTVFAHQ